MKEPKSEAANRNGSPALASAHGSAAVDELQDAAKLYAAAVAAAPKNSSFSIFSAVCDRLETAAEMFCTQRAIEKEQARWQEAIYDVCCKAAPGANIDGAGCDSGDPLDFTLTEIRQALNWARERTPPNDGAKP